MTSVQKCQSRPFGVGFGYREQAEAHAGRRDKNPSSCDRDNIWGFCARSREGFGIVLTFNRQRKAHNMKTDPQISANKLIEYCFARSTRRTAIIEDIIKPKNFLLDTRYNDIERAMMHFLEHRGKDDSRLSQLDKTLLSRVAVTSHDEQRLLIAHDAIELCRTMSLARLPASGNILSLPDKQPKLLLKGVAVSVRPTNFMSLNQLGKKEKGIGLIKPYLSKASPLTAETSSLHGALLHWYAAESFGDSGEARSDLCFIVDVFAQKIFSAPDSFRQRRKLLEASCQEIADRWQSIRTRLIASEKPTSKRRES